MGFNKNKKAWEAVNKKYVDRLLKSKKLSVNPESLETFENARPGQGFVGIVDMKERKLYLRLCFHENDGALRADKDGREYKQGEYIVTTSQRGGGRVRLVAAHKIAVIDMLDEGEHEYEYYTEESLAKRQHRTTAEKEIASGRFCGFGIWKGGPASLIIKSESQGKPKPYSPNEYTLVTNKDGSLSLYYALFDRKQDGGRYMHMRLVEVTISEELEGRLQRVIANPELTSIQKHIMLERAILDLCESHMKAKEDAYEGQIKNIKVVSTSLNTNAFKYDPLAVMHTTQNSQFHFGHGQGILRELPVEVGNIVEATLAKHKLTNGGVIDGMQQAHWRHVKGAESIINGVPELYPKSHHSRFEMNCRFDLVRDLEGRDSAIGISAYFEHIMNGELGKSFMDKEGRAKHKAIFRQSPSAHVLNSFIEYNFDINKRDKGRFVEQCMQQAADYFDEKSRKGGLFAIFSSANEGMSLSAYQDMLLHLLVGSEALHKIHKDMDKELVAYLEKLDAIPFEPIDYLKDNTTQFTCNVGLVFSAVANGCTQSLAYLLKRAKMKDEGLLNKLVNEKFYVKRSGLFYTPLWQALIREQLDHVKLLIQSGADLSVVPKTRKPETYLHTAVRFLPDALNMILDQKVIDVNALNSEGESVLIAAARVNDMSALQLLLQHGADPEIADKEGKKAIDYIPEERRVEFNQMLTEVYTQKQGKTSRFGLYQGAPAEDAAGSAENANVPGPDPARHDKKS